MAIDALISLLPLLMIALLAARLSYGIVEHSAEGSHSQQVFDKLVSAADYTVDIGAVRRQGALRYPNWIDPERIDGPYVEDLRAREGLDTLIISMAAPGDPPGQCIYRIVVIGEERAIGKLYVCGK